MDKQQITTDEKICRKCGCTFPRTSLYFRLDKRHSDNLESRCRSCAYSDDKAYRVSHPDKRRADHTRWQQKNPDLANSYHQKWLINNQYKADAHNAIKLAIHSHKIPNAKTLKCCTCGKQAFEYHHKSYEPENWLNVVPVCRKCHKAFHAQGGAS